ncbi:MAG: nicotinate-nucleotide adenylyltransferase [Deferrisomatales bacterium]|nr:nicotinate-nucleotide adenylyltransferase [Deferrisomatales bacterium]
MQLGVLGGTFDPVHLGHLRAAEEAREALGLDRVLFLPARTPPHKVSRRITPSAARLELVQRAVADNPGFAASDLEVNRDGPSYSVDTLAELRRDLGPDDRLWFLLGEDAFREVHTWHNYPELFRLADIGVLRRPPTGAPPPPGGAGPFTPTPVGYRHGGGREVRFIDVTLLDISSTRVRRALAAGRSVRYLVPEPIWPVLTEWRRDHPEWFAESQPT